MEVLRTISCRVTLFALVVAFLPLAAHGRSPDTPWPDGICSSPQAMLEATQTGNVMVQQALAAGMPWGDRSLNEYVNRLGQNLARSSGSQQMFAIYVLYNPEVNARSFPGGHIVINSGAISRAESEAELASVLSHEIAHENSCDCPTGPRRGKPSGLIPLVPTVGLAGPAGVALASGSDWAETVARARSSRSKEERADRLAAQYLVRAGYDPHAAAQFFQRVQAEQERSGGELGGLLATHPRSSDRRNKLEKIIPNLPPPEFALHDEAEFLRMRRAVRDYDEIYSRVVGVRVHGLDAPPPELSRRPLSPASH
jgi:predicted Zn-dependent protease